MLLYLASIQVKTICFTASQPDTLRDNFVSVHTDRIQVCLAVKMASVMHDSQQDVSKCRMVKKKLF